MMSNQHIRKLLSKALLHSYILFWLLNMTMYQTGLHYYNELKVSDHVALVFLVHYTDTICCVQSM